MHSTPELGKVFILFIQHFNRSTSTSLLLVYSMEGTLNNK